MKRINKNLGFLTFLAVVLVWAGSFYRASKSPPTAQWPAERRAVCKDCEEFEKLFGEQSDELFKAFDVTKKTPPEQKDPAPKFHTGDIVKIRGLNISGVVDGKSPGPWSNNRYAIHYADKNGVIHEVEMFDKEFDIHPDIPQSNSVPLCFR